MSPTQLAETPPAGWPDEAPKSVRIVAVCAREIAILTAKIAECGNSDFRTKLLRERADIRQLRAFAERQPDYAAWLARCRNAANAHHP